MAKAGRPLGSKNRCTSEVREKFQQLIESQLITLEEDFKSLTAKDRIRYVIDMSKYVLPQLKTVELGNGIGGEGYDFNETLRILRGETFAK